MPTQMPYKYGSDQEDDQDPYRRAGPGGASEPMADDGSSTPESAPARPAPYQPPAATAKSREDDPQPETFAQQQEAGKARPPAPIVEPANPTAGVGVGDAPGAIVEPAVEMPGIVGGAPEAIVEPPNPIGGVGVGGEAPGAIIEPSNPTGMVGEGESAVDSLLPMLMGGVEGQDNAGTLRNATNAKIRGQLESSSPYDSQEVRNEYDWLSGNIDDQFSTDERALDERMAARGLYGSAGKDFHSGRLSDLNVGKRNAKTTLARDLANKFATTKGQYDANAINQGLDGTNATQNSQLQWLQQLMGYGQQGFENDLSTAQFNAGQDMNSQDFLLRMLAAGYGG